LGSGAGWCLVNGVLFLASRDPHDLDGAANDIGGAVFASGAFGHRLESFDRHLLRGFPGSNLLCFDLAAKGDISLHQISYLTVAFCGAIRSGKCCCGSLVTIGHIAIDSLPAWR
jgi:hypothetical protein